MISRRLVNVNISWSFLWLGVCLSCFLASGNSQTSEEDELLYEILNSIQNDT